jgi:sphingomyelin phosphodiesterase
MKLKIFIFLFALFASIHLSSAAVNDPGFLATEEILKKTIELEAWIPSLKFIEELRNMYTQVVDIRGRIPHSPTETIAALDMFATIDLKPVCNSCLAFVGHIRKMVDKQSVENLIKKVAIKICEKKQSAPVCLGAIQSYGDILFNVALDRTILPEHVCERLGMCPHTRGRDHLKEYIKDVLKDKPKTEYATPTLKSTYTILQIADPHVDLEYQEGTNAFCDQPLCCRAEYGPANDTTKAAQYWGTQSTCDIPLRTFQQFLQFTSSKFDIDMIVWTGDNIAHDIWNQTQEKQTLNTYNITEDILNYFPNTPVYPMFGNHEPYPADQFDTTGNASSWLTEQLSDMWRPWLDDKALETFRNFSYYAMENKELNVKVIALDTQACDTTDFYLIRDPSDPMHQLEWLRNELYESEAKNQKVFLLGHIPPGDGGCYDQWSSRLRALVDRFTNTVRAQFFGHTHHDHFNIFRSFADDTPVGIALMAPAFTTYSYIKPSFRIIEVDAETHVPVNYYQYRLDLDKWNKNTTGPIEWDLAYSFLEEYDLKDMSFASFDKLAEKIKSNPEVARTYQWNHDSGSHDQSLLTERETQSVYCQAKYSVYGENLKCLGLHAQTGDIMTFAKQFLPGKWYSDKC